MPYCKSAIDQLFQGIDANFQMCFYKITSHALVTIGCFNTIGYHRLIADQAKGPLLGSYYKNPQKKL